MKKIITLLILTGLVSVSVMAGETRKLEKTPFTDWTFGTSVETRAGYNLDSKLFGLKGSTVVNLEAKFYDQATTFEEDMSQKVRGKIVVDSLTVKVATGDKSHDYKQTGVLHVDWASVIATVYFGPNLYIKMGDINSDQVRYVGSIADGDFSVIKYSILTPSFTGGRLGRTDYRTQIIGSDVTSYTDAEKIAANTARYAAEVTARAAGKSPADVTADGQTAYDAALVGKGTVTKGATTYSAGTTSDRKTQTIANVSIMKDNLKTFVIGFEMPKQFKTEVGFAMRFNYLEKVEQPYNSYNVNALVEIYAMEEKLKFKVKADAVNGEIGEYEGTKEEGGSSGSKAFNGGVTSNGNPLTVGGSMSYTHALGKFNIVPALGAEMQFEEKRKVNAAANTFKFKRYNEGMSLGAFANKKADGGYFSTMTTPYEVGFGLSFNWKSLGETADKGFEGLAKGNVGTTDGVSLSGFVGSAPYSPIPDIAMPYYGVQLSFWDSQKDGKPGIIPGVAFGIIGNVNIAPGATLDLKEYANGTAGTAYKTYELKLGNRVDAGVGVVLRTEKLLGMIQPYTGFVYKALDITGENEVLTTELKDVDDSKLEYSAYVNDRYKTAATDTASELASRTDMRVKFGIDITLTPKVSINGEWASGNIIGSTLNEEELNRAYDSYDYFENADKDGNPMLGSDARAGVVSVGLKVAF